jgi:hypothetical protein
MIPMKRTSRFLYTLATAGFAVTVVACDDGTGLESLDDQMVLDAAILAADATVEEVTMWSQSFGFGLMPAAPATDPATGGFAAMGRPGGEGSWSGEFSGTREKTCYDELGVEQAECDPLTTESIHVIRAIEGSIVRDNFTAEISRVRDMTVSGMLGEETERTWNGSGTSSTDRSGVLEDGTARSHSSQGSVTFVDVVVPIPGSDPRWPTSGTITRSMTMTRTNGDETVTREVEIVITFDGSSIATAVVNGETMEIDLSTRMGRSPLRRGRG